MIGDGDVREAVKMRWRNREVEDRYEDWRGDLGGFKLANYCSVLGIYDHYRLQRLAVNS